MGNNPSRRETRLREYPMAFHLTHSRNMELAENESYIIRSNGYCDGICFGSRPVEPNEVIELVVAEMSSTWNGNFRFGFSANDPATIDSTSLPRYSCPDLCKKPGFWLHALFDENNLHRNDVVHFYITAQGCVYYGINGTAAGRVLSGLPTNRQLWPAIDVYGNTVALIIRAPMAQRIQNGLCAGQNLGDVDVDAVETPDYVLRYYGCLSTSPFLYHKNHGKNIHVSDDGQIANHVTIGGGCSYAFSAMPLRINTVWLVLVTRKNLRWGRGLGVGLTTADPSALPNHKRMPPDWQNMGVGEWFVKDEVYTHPEVGDELAISLSKNGDVQVAINGENFTTLMTVPFDSPLWVVLDLGGCVQALRSIGLHTQSVSPLPGLPLWPRPCKAEEEAVQVAAFDATAAVETTSVGRWPECSICCDNEVSCVFMRCGHAGACMECAQNVVNRSANCPFCRHPIQDVVRIYKP